jgi:hypothetical protein
MRAEPDLQLDFPVSRQLLRYDYITKFWPRGQVTNVLYGDGRVVGYTEAEWIDEEGLRHTLAAGLAALRSERQRPELDRASTGLKAEEVILWGM